ncbi:hypothetical protein EDB84DRAFT_1559556 [Lactarius hengduanensis]|nr:hypothetical protein EDB84DRAFT_1559556 [Lactarius hengduanensis]
MSADSIQCLGSDRFYVRSLSDLSKMYLVDLGTDTSDLSENHLIEHGKDKCDCPDWPRARLCKHIAAIAHFSSDGTIQITRAAPEPEQEVYESPQDTQQDTQGDGVPKRWPAFLTRDRPESLAGGVASHGAYLDRDRRANGGKATEEITSHNSSSPAHPPAAERIGMLNRKQPRNARTAAQNADARARVASTTDGAEAPPSQSTKRRRNAPVPHATALFRACARALSSVRVYPNAAYSQVPYHRDIPNVLAL